MAFLLQMYVFGWVKLVANISSYDGAFSDVLISNKHDFKLLNGTTIAGETDIIAHLYDQTNYKKSWALIIQSFTNKILQILSSSIIINKNIKKNIMTDN